MRSAFTLLQRSLASPSRHPRLAVVVGRLLGIAFLICFTTGLYSHFIQNPIPGMWFPNRPSQLYRITQGLHVITGITCVPLLLTKLYVVFPLLFRFPPIQNFLHFLERASITIFVSASLVQLASGLMNTAQWYVFPFSFRQTHYALGYLIVASLAIHIATKLPVIQRWWTRRASVDADGHLQPVLANEGDLSREPVVLTGFFTSRIQRALDRRLRRHAAPEALSRRTLVAGLGASAAVATLTTAGQSVPLLDGATLFAPRKPGGVGEAAQFLPINKSAREARVTEKARSADWTLLLKHGERQIRLTRQQLLAMPQQTVRLPIACVEGWSKDATWTGVRVQDLMLLVGAGERDIVVQSLQRGAYARTMLESNFVRDPLSLIALKLNGSTLSLDHGYPARLIAPARPGVLQTKWLESLEAK